MTKPSIRSTSHKPQHSGSPRKTQLIKFRVTPEEKRDLEIMCEILHVNMSTLLRRCLRTKPIKQTIVVTGGGEDALNILSDLLGQCGRIGSNLNQLARYFNSGGKDSEQNSGTAFDRIVCTHTLSAGRREKDGRTVWQPSSIQARRTPILRHLNTI